MSTKCTDNRNTCGTVVASACVPYTGSDLTSFDVDNLPCNPNINDIFKELDVLIKNLKEEVSVENVELGCLENCNCSVNRIDELFNLIISKICLLQESVTALNEKYDNIGLAKVVVDLACFNNPCFNASNNEHTILEILMLLLSEVCQLKNK
jgi:hypothetical protein